MDFREKRALDRSKLINEDKYNKVLEKAKQAAADLKSEVGVNKTYTGVTPNAGYFNDITSKLHGPEVPPANTLTEIKDIASLPKSKFLKDTVVEGAEALKSKPTSKIMDLAKKGLGGTGKLAATLGPLAKALGLAGTIAGAMGAGQKAMAGDFTGAATQGVGTATDLVPGVNELKMALRTEGLGAGSDKIDPNMKPFNFAPYQVNNSKMDASKLPHAENPNPINASEEPKNRARYQDLRELFNRGK